MTHGGGDNYYYLSHKSLTVCSLSSHNFRVAHRPPTILNRDFPEEDLSAASPDPTTSGLSVTRQEGKPSAADHPPARRSVGSLETYTLWEQIDMIESSFVCGRLVEFEELVLK